MIFKTTPAYSFSLSKKCKLDKDDRLITPGPEKYNPKKLILRDGTLNIGLSKRIYPKIKETPGPGTYNVPSIFPEGLKYSMGSKLYENNKNQTNIPGPGTYRIMNKSQSSFYSFGIKHKNSKIDDIPGPGNYNLRKKNDLDMPCYIFGKEKRNIFSTNSSSERIPGPIYNFNEDAIRINNPKFSFGKEERKTINIKNKIKIPGPGAYNHKEYLGKEGLKISFSPRYEIRNNNFNKLGPGQYNKTDLNFYKPKSPSTKMGKLKRFSLSSNDIFSNDTPGPGKYNYINSIKTIKKTDPAWKMGTGKRKPLMEIDKYIPGPGTYNVSKKIGKDSPYFSMGHKEKEKLIKFNSPGPGKYNLDKLITFVHSPSWKMGTGKKLLKLKINNDIPGPGTYSVRGKSSSGPKCGFGIGKRGFLTINNNPGPGTYHIPCSIEVVNDYTRRKGNFNEEFRYI